MAPILPRGPDGCGTHVVKDGRIGFVHTRLAILDPTSRSDQPMVDGNTGVTVAYNGEIYNFSELRADLKNEGVSFSTTGDTEVLLNGYIRHGINFFRLLRGMYTFIIFDARDDSIIAFRDPLGIKPLYIAGTPDSLVFSSSPLAAAQFMGSPELDPAAAVSLAIMGCVLEPLSKWRGVSPLKPGIVYRWQLTSTRLRLELVAIETAFVWRSDEREQNEHLSWLQFAVEDTIKAHFTSDVPVAIFQSSGLDSTLFSTVAHSLGLKPTLLTIGFREFDGSTADEVRGASATALRLGLDHRIGYVTARDFAEIEDKFFERMESPTADGVNGALVAHLAKREGFKVAISGIGGDEIFGGYPSFRQLPMLARIAPALRHSYWRPLLDGALSLIASNPNNAPKLRYASQHLGSFPQMYLLRRCYFAPEELFTVLKPEIIEEGLPHFEAAFAIQAAACHGNDEAAVRALERDVYMRNVLLKDADWTGMAFGVEVRTPFVDTPFIRTICDPNDRCLYTKADQRALISRIDPKFDSTPRAKTGFVVPHHIWSADEGGSVTDARRAGFVGPRLWNRKVLQRQFGDWVLPQTPSY